MYGALCVLPKITYNHTGICDSSVPDKLLLYGTEKSPLPNISLLNQKSTKIRIEKKINTSMSQSSFIRYNVCQQDKSAGM